MFQNAKYFHFLTKAVLIVSLLFICDSSIFAASKSTKLKHIIHKIDTLQTNLQQEKKHQIAIQSQLKHAEVAIGNISIATKNTSKKLTHENEILKALKIKQGFNQKKLREEKYHLNDEIRSAYMSSKVNYFKVLLNGEDPNQLHRFYIYYRYLLQNRAKNIAAITGTLKTIRRNDQEIQKQTKILQKLYAHQKSEREQLEIEQKKRNASLKMIDSTLKTQQARLQQLLADKRALEKLIAKIDALSRKQAPLKISGSLGMLRGKLLSPTSGTITKAYASGETELNGVIISAAEDQEVHAIAKGRVVYADWFPGYGLMLIIDHGQGYMSLYGRNHTLYKKIGDPVDSGEAIATVGNSGGYEKTGLYFAMRYNGKPVDPTVWCKI